VIVRLDANGVTINTFDGDGVWNHPATLTGSLQVAVDSQGRILFGGNDASFAMVGRIRLDGTLDPMFNTGAIRQFGLTGGSETVVGLTEATTGEIYAVASTSSGSAQAYLTRMSSSGTMDAGFAGTGFRQFTSAGVAAVVDTQHRFLVIGGNSGLARVIRFLPDGSYDPGFGTGGIREFDPTAGSDIAEAIDELPDGRLMVAGVTSAGTIFTALLSGGNGAVDAEHGTSGVQLHDVATGTDQPLAIQATTDGSVVVAGYGTNTTVDGILLSLDGATVADHDGGAADWSASSGAFGVCLDSVAGSNLVADMTVHAGCAQTPAAAWWNPVPATPASILHSSVGGATGLTANLSFGLRTDPAQRPGAYRAGVTFEVIAPA
jgi:hypothetical protein